MATYTEIKKGDVVDLIIEDRPFNYASSGFVTFNKPRTHTLRGIVASVGENYCIHVICENGVSHRRYLRLGNKVSGEIQYKDLTDETLHRTGENVGDYFFALILRSFNETCRPDDRIE